MGWWVIGFLIAFVPALVEISSEILEEVNDIIASIPNFLEYLKEIRSGGSKHTII